MIKDFLILVFFSAFYSLTFFFSEVFFWLYAVVSPIVISTLGYSTLSLPPVAKRLLLAFLPIASMPILIFFPDLEKYQVIIYIHCFAIGCFFTQLYEIILKALKLIFSFFKKIREKVRN